MKSRLVFLKIFFIGELAGKAFSGDLEVKKNRKHCDGYQRRKVATDLMSDTSEGSPGESEMSDHSDSEAEDVEERPEVREYLAKQIGQMKPDRKRKSSSSLGDDVRSFNELFLANQVTCEKNAQKRHEENLKMQKLKIKVLQDLHKENNEISILEKGSKDDKYATILELSTWNQVVKDMKEFLPFAHQVNKIIKCYNGRRKAVIKNVSSLKTDSEVCFEVQSAFSDDLVGDFVNIIFCSNCNCA